VITMVIIIPLVTTLITVTWFSYNHAYYGHCILVVAAVYVSPI
jgi:hypothetical protein